VNKGKETKLRRGNTTRKRLFYLQKMESSRGRLLLSSRQKKEESLPERDRKDSLFLIRRRKKKESIMYPGIGGGKILLRKHLEQSLQWQGKFSPGDDSDHKKEPLSRGLSAILKKRISPGQFEKGPMPFSQGRSAWPTCWEGKGRDWSLAGGGKRGERSKGMGKIFDLERGRVGKNDSGRGEVKKARRWGGGNGRIAFLLKLDSR